MDLRWCVCVNAKAYINKRKGRKKHCVYLGAMGGILRKGNNVC